MRSWPVFFLALSATSLPAQTPTDPPSIGTVSTRGNVIILELDPTAVPAANLFDLNRRTLHFTPEGSGYRVENRALQWDREYGTEITNPKVTLRGFRFPIAGQQWDSLFVNLPGSISFGRDDTAFPISRFGQLRNEAVNPVNTVPVIAAFIKPRMTGKRYVKELPDRAVVTWDLTEPFAGIFDFTWTPTTNRFQIVLHRDGAIDISYDDVAARDAIVGVYTPGSSGTPADFKRDLSAITGSDGPFATVFEAFHHAGLPNPQAMACTVIRALGDHFDFLVYYSDFRVDNQEGGTPSTGGIGTKVTGYGRDPRRASSSYCSDGRLQATYQQPVYIDSNQGQERAPRNAGIPNYAPWPTRPHGRGRFDFAMSQISHELGHRWMSFASAIVGNDTIELGPTHWQLGLHAPAAFPYGKPGESSTMGGAVWRDNRDGTFTLLDDNYYVPAKGWSHLDLYLMGLLPAESVPEFFFLENLHETGVDGRGNRVFRGERVNLRVQNVIARHGPRLPGYDQAQRAYNTGMVGIVWKGQQPSRMLLDRLNFMGNLWIDYWYQTTGGVSTMTIDPRGITSPPRNQPQ